MESIWKRHGKTKESWNSGCLCVAGINFDRDSFAFRGGSRGGRNHLLVRPEVDFGTGKVCLVQGFTPVLLHI